MLFWAFVCIAAAQLAAGAYIDLTHPINANTLYWIKDEFVLTPLVRQTDPHWIATNRLSTAEHGGTHIDAPYHFNRDGWKLGQVPLNRLFMVEGVLINKTKEAQKDPEYQLTVKDIEDWEAENGPLPNACVVLVDFGWSHKYPDRKPYLGLKDDADDWDRHFPAFSGEASKWLAKSGKVYGVGVDTASPDSVGDPIAHKVITKENIFILENLKLHDLPEQIPARGFKLVILPMRVEEGTGGPAHVILVTKDKKDSSEL